MEHKQTVDVLPNTPALDPLGPFTTPIPPLLSSCMHPLHGGSHQPITCSDEI